MRYHLFLSLWNKSKLFWLSLGLSIAIAIPVLAIYPGSFFFDPVPDDSIYLGNCNTISCLFEPARSQNKPYGNFAEIVKEAGLMSKFNDEIDEGKPLKHTVFVPRNQVIPERTLQTWIRHNNRKALKQFVNSYVVNGQITEDDIKNGYVETKEDTTIYIVPTKNRNYSIDRNIILRSSDGQSANPIESYHAGNGIVILIDRVLFEPNFEK